MSYISEGRGVSLLMRKTVEPYITGGNIRVIRLDHKLVDALSIVANESRRPLTRMCARFIDFAMEYFSNAIQPV